jgi:glycerol-3-phosphate acyltransferase PlsX
MSENIKEMSLEQEIASGRISFFHAPQVIPDDETVSRVWRNYQNSSLVASIALQKEGVVDASLSAGETGALFSTALFLLGREKGVSRPALAATLPTQTGQNVLLLDVGANLECRGSHLVDFAKLGEKHMRALRGGVAPRVALLNVGHEASKGTRAVRECAEILSSDLENYVGFIEGSYLLSGDADVVVCDGFTGNAMLKLSESVFQFVKKHLAESLTGEALDKMELFNADLYGSVPVLGVNGHVFKAHGGSSINALTHAIITAVKTVYLVSSSKN